MQFPILFYEGNLLINRAGEWWAAYRLRPWTYDHLNTSTKLEWWSRLTRLFSAVELEGQLLVVPRTIPATAPLQALRREIRGPLAGFGHQYLDGLAQHLSEQPPSVEYQTFILYRLPQPNKAGTDAPALANQVARKLKHWRRHVEDWQQGVPVIPVAALAAMKREEEQLHARLMGHLRMDRCTADQLTWLLQRRYWAGIGEPPGRPGWQPDALVVDVAGEPRIQPLTTEILALAEGEIDLRHPRRVGVHQVGQAPSGTITGYQAFMALSAIPDEMTMPGAEWIHHLHELPYPVEVCVRWSPVSYREAIAFLRRKRMETADQVQQAASSGDVPPLDVQEAEAQLDHFEQDLKERRCPALETTVFLVVSATGDQVLGERVTGVRDTMADLQMPVEVPTGDQHRLFQEFLPGAPRQIKPTNNYSPDPPYLHRFLPEVLGAGMAGATNDVGDSAGVYIGRTGTLGRPVYWHAARGPRVNRSASIAFLGTLGGGKTFSARLLTLQAVMTQGARALLIDPKGESDHLVRHLPEVLRQHTNLITLSARDEDAGLLDLLAMARGGAIREAGNMAVSILAFLADAKTREEQLALHEAVEVALRATNPSMSLVIEHLCAAPGVASEIGRYLAHLRGRAYASLLFGDGRERSIDTKAPLNILQLQHLTLPEKGKSREEMTADEVISAAVMYAVVGFASQFVARDRDTFKIVLLDEAWRVMASSTGMGVVRYLLRTGRAMNAGIYLVSQSVADLLDEGVRNNLGARFVFRSTDEEEVRALLQLLNMEATPQNMATVRELDNGQALVQDLDGRIGVVQVDAVFEEFEHAFDTRPPAPAATTTN